MKFRILFATFFVFLIFSLFHSCGDVASDAVNSATSPDSLPQSNSCPGHVFGAAVYSRINPMLHKHVHQITCQNCGYYFEDECEYTEWCDICGRNADHSTGNNQPPSPPAPEANPSTSLANFTETKPTKGNSFLVIVSYEDILENENMKRYITYKQNNINVATVKYEDTRSPGELYHDWDKNKAERERVLGKIKNLYTQNTGKQFYILIVGHDTGIGNKYYIPRYVGTSSKFVHRAASTDLYFTYLEGEDKGVKAMVGRWPVINLTDLQYLVEKSIEFEKEALSKDVVLVRQFGEGESGVGAYSFDENIKETKRLLTGFTFKDFKSNNGSAAINAEINKGNRIVTYVGHGGTDSWSSYNYTHVKNLKNTSPNFVVVATCNTGDISDNNNIGREFINQQYGAAAYIGATSPTLNWFSDLFTNGNKNASTPSQYLYKYDTDVHGLFPSTFGANKNVYTAGGAFMAGLRAMEKLYKYGNKDNGEMERERKFAREIYTLLGDPSLIINR